MIQWSPHRHQIYPNSYGSALICCGSGPEKYWSITHVQKGQSRLTDKQNHVHFKELQSIDQVNVIWWLERYKRFWQYINHMIPSQCHMCKRYKNINQTGSDITQFLFLSISVGGNIWPSLRPSPGLTIRPPVQPCAAQHYCTAWNMEWNRVDQDFLGQMSQMSW